MLTHGMRTLFLAQAAITSLVPSQTVNRISMPCIFTDNAPQGVLPPYIAIHATSTDPMLTFDAFNPSLKSDDIEIDVVGYSIPQARKISDTLRQFFDDYAGTLSKGNNQATANVLPTVFNVVADIDGVRGVRCPAFTGSIQVVNISQSQPLPVYPEVGGAFNAGSANAAYSVPAGNTAIFTQTALLTYTATTAESPNGEPSDAIKAVWWMDENYSYDFPDEGRDTKYHIITTVYQVMSEQGV